MITVEVAVDFWFREAKCSSFAGRSKLLVFFLGPRLKCSQITHLYILSIYIYIYIYKTETFETSTIFHISTLLKKKKKKQKNKTKTKEKKGHKPDTTLPVPSSQLLLYELHVTKIPFPRQDPTGRFSAFSFSRQDPTD